jgi:hypothetical protein
MIDLVERVAAELWRAEAVDSGSPASVADRRTLEAFANEADTTRAKWHKFARAVVDMVLDEAAGNVQRIVNEAGTPGESLLAAHIRALGGDT